MSLLLALLLAAAPAPPAPPPEHSVFLQITDLPKAIQGWDACTSRRYFLKVNDADGSIAIPWPCDKSLRDAILEWARKEDGR